MIRCREMLQAKQLNNHTKNIMMTQNVLLKPYWQIRSREKVKSFLVDFVITTLSSGK